MHGQNFLFPLESSIPMFLHLLSGLGECLDLYIMIVLFNLYDHKHIIFTSLFISTICHSSNLDVLLIIEYFFCVNHWSHRAEQDKPIPFLMMFTVEK